MDVQTNHLGDRALSADPGAHWTLDRRVPLALIFTLTLQVITFTGLAAVGYYRLGDVAERVKVLEIESRVTERAASLRDSDNRVAFSELSGTIRSLGETMMELRVALRNLEMHALAEQRRSQPTARD